MKLIRRHDEWSGPSDMVNGFCNTSAWPMWPGLERFRCRYRISSLLSHSTKYSGHISGAIDKVKHPWVEFFFPSIIRSHSASPSHFFKACWTYTFQVFFSLVKLLRHGISGPGRQAKHSYSDPLTLSSGQAAHCIMYATDPKIGLSQSCIHILSGF